MRKDILSREVTIEVVVGLFVVLVFFGLAYFTFMVSGKAWGEKRYQMEIVFSDVMGLRTKDNVVVRGMPIGEVKELTLKPDGVHVTAEIKESPDKGRLRMHKDYKIQVVATSLLGGRMLQISEGTEESGALPNNYCFTGRDPHDLMRDAADVVNSAKKALIDEGGIIDNLKVATAGLRDLSDRMSAGKGTLGKLLSEDESLYADMKSGAASLRNVLERIDQGKSTLGKLASADDEVYDDLKSVIASLKTVSERLEKGQGTLGKLLSPDDQIYEDLKSSVASIRALSKRLEEGKGLIGRLTTDDDTLYNEIRDVLNEAKATLDDLRETTPVVTFTSILFGAF